MSEADTAAVKRLIWGLEFYLGPDASEVAAELMPVLREYAADEIERIAEERTWTTEHDNEVVSVRDLYEGIARPRGELEPVMYDFPPDNAERSS